MGAQKWSVARRRGRLVVEWWGAAVVAGCWMCKRQFWVQCDGACLPARGGVELRLMRLWSD